LNLPTPLLSLSLGLGLVGLSACSSTNKNDGLNQVDDLLGCIERVYVESELANARLRDAMQQLVQLTAVDFSADPMAAHLALAEAVESSELQAKELAGSIAPMKVSGEALFARWTKDLEAFRSDSMRARSSERLTETRARYDAIVRSADPVQERIDALNASLSDSVLFLANDMNAASIASLRSDVEDWAADAAEIGEQLEVCLAAAEQYMRSAALPEGLGAPSEGATAKSSSR
jgi:hypothetical protein